MRTRTPVRTPGMVALRTRFLGPTDTEGARIAVWLANGGLTPADRSEAIYPYDHGLDGPANHAQAATRLVNDKKSHGHWDEYICLMQAAIDDDGYVFVPYWAEEPS